VTRLCSWEVACQWSVIASTSKPARVVVDQPLRRRVAVGSWSCASGPCWLTDQSVKRAGSPRTVDWDGPGR
jgi:hypothetical protein